MNQPLTMKVGDSTSWHKFTLDSRYVTILSANSAIEIRPEDGAPFEVDDADEIDFGVSYGKGGNIWVRNVSETLNNIIIAASSKYVRRKKSVELTADLSSIQIIDSDVGINPLKNNVQVENPVVLHADNVVKTTEQNPLTDLSINNFPAAFEVSNQLDKKFVISSVTHILTQVEINAGGWIFNSGAADRLIVNAQNGVRMFNHELTVGQSLILDNLAANQNLTFSGVDGQEIDILVFTAV